jgi:hypothetical protein
VSTFLSLQQAEHLQKALPDRDQLTQLFGWVDFIVQSLSHNYDPWVWRMYKPTLIDVGISIGSFAWFGMFFLLFIKFLPAMAIGEIKEILPAPNRKAARRPPRRASSRTRKRAGAASSSRPM